MNFDALKPATVTAQITTSYGKTLEVPLQLLSWERWESIGRSVPEPVVPKTLPAASGKPEDMLPNPQDKAYLEKKALADEERTARRVLAALEGAGMVIPGNTVAARAAAIKEMDAAILQALIGVLAKVFWGVNARLEASAESFRASPVDAAADADMPTLGDYTGGV